MKEFLKAMGKIVLVVLLIWHMFAVATYAFPRESDNIINEYVKTRIHPIVTPYMLATSQWQLWNLFAPDPLRRVTIYHIEYQQNGLWKQLRTIQPGSFSIWRHAVQFKMMGNMLTEFSDNPSPIAIRYLHLHCTEHGLEAETPIRLQFEYYVIPQLDRPASVAWWRTWTPDRTIYTGFTTACPART